jgi:hypothetical protein
MAFPSGVYIVENVQNRNWAILKNDDDGDVISGTDADTNIGHKVGIQCLMAAVKLSFVFAVGDQKAT